MVNSYIANAKLVDKAGKLLLEASGTGLTLADAASFAMDKLLARLHPSASFARIIVEAERLP